MMTIEITLESDFPSDMQEEFIDRMCYVSSSIDNVIFDTSRDIKFTVSTEANLPDIELKIKKAIKRFLAYYKKPKYKILFDNPVTPINKEDVFPDLLRTDDVFKLGEGQYGISKIALELFDYFDNAIKKIGHKFEALEHRYPTLIPIKALQRVNYLSSRPESLNFVSHLKEDIDIIDEFSNSSKTLKDKAILGSMVETDSVASSAVCFHTYHHFQDGDYSFPNNRLVIGTVGKCFRYESKNLKALERLRDFTMREVICLGTPREVLAFRERALELANKYLTSLNLNFNVRTANDPFFVEEFGHQTMFQRTFDLKYEFRALLPSTNSYMAIGSLNYHRDFLGKAFNIKNNGEIVHSSCLAFGIERCIYSFLSQFGTDKSKWPKSVLNNMEI